MAWILTERQESSYTEEVAFYGSDLQSGAAADGGAKDPSVPALIEADIPALLRQSKANVDQGAMGRSNVDIALTLDMVKVPVGVNARIQNGDALFFKLTGPSTHPNLGEWWACQGNGRITPSRGEREANEIVFFCKAVPDPTV
jgi:hypothetical protein